MSPAKTVSAFVLERLEGEPIATQVELYHALAELTPEPAIAKEMRQLAYALSEIGDRQMQLRFRASGRGNYKRES